MSTIITSDSVIETCVVCGKALEDTQFLCSKECEYKYREMPKDGRYPEEEARKMRDRYHYSFSNMRIKCFLEHGRQHFDIPIKGAGISIGSHEIDSLIRFYMEHCRNNKLKFRKYYPSKWYLAKGIKETIGAKYKR